MSKRKIVLYFVMVFLILASLASCSNKSDVKGKRKSKAENQIKVFTFEDLKKELHGSKGVLIINFWATWCGACREEMPDLIQFYDDYKGKVKLIGLALDESKEDVKKFMELSKVNFPVYLSTEQLAQHLMVNGIPVTYIFKNGKYVKYHIGKYELSDLKHDVNMVLK